MVQIIVAADFPATMRTREIVKHAVLFKRKDLGFLYTNSAYSWNRPYTRHAAVPCILTAYTMGAKLPILLL